MKTITIELPDNLSLPGSDAPSDKDLEREVRLALAIEWYRQGRVSQGQGAEIAGLSRVAFLESLFHAKVPACQETVEDLMGVWDRDRAADRECLPAHPHEQGGPA